MQPTEEDAREDPLFDDPDDLDYDEDMARLMREVYSAFKSEVSGADLRADASKLKDMLAGLQAEAQGNTPLLDSTRHAGVTTMAARAATVRERGFLDNDAAPVVTGKRSRTKPSRFEAGATRLHGSRKFEKRPSPPPRAASCPPAPRSRTDNAERARRRKAAREAYAKAIEELADNTFVDLSWEQRKIVAVCSYARALSEGCAKMSAAHVASMASRVHERTVRRFVKEWLANEGFFHPMNWGTHRKAPYFLDDEVISSKASRWLRVNTGFKKGTLIISDSAHLLISPFVVVAKWEQHRKHGRLPALPMWRQIKEYSRMPYRNTRHLQQG